MVDKIMGSETELFVGSYEEKDDNSSVSDQVVSPFDPNNSRKEKAFETIHDILAESDVWYSGEFAANGSRIYEELGFFIESSTAEERKPHRVVIREKANEKIIDWARKEAENRFRVKIDITKNNMDVNGTPFGCHENYFVDKALVANNYSLLVKKLVPHLLSRIIYIGAGEVYKGKYVMSPRAMVIEDMVNCKNTENRPFIHTREEPHASYGHRLHGVTPDSLMSESAAFLKYFTTSAILTEIEEGNFDDIIKLTDPLGDIKKISWLGGSKELNSADWTVKTNRGEMNVIEIQKYYMHKISEDTIMDEWDVLGMRLWQDTLERLENNSFPKLEKRIDWLLKRRCIDEQVKKHMEIPLQIIAYTTSQQYHEIAPRRSFFYEKEVNGLTERLFSNKQILKAVYEPPQDTRAKLRVSLPIEDIHFVGWDSITLKNLKVINMKDPYQTTW